MAQTMSEVKDQIESFIDNNSLAFVLEVLGQICFEKGFHIKENWQDITTANTWNLAANKISALADKVGL